MAARRKTSKRKAAPTRKPATRKATRKKAVRKSSTPRRARELPNDEAWRELVETAIEKPDPDVSAAAPRRKSK